MIELRNINFRYAGGTDAGGLVNIDLTIPDGQVILLCGQSGCGKTTLTRLINGLIPNYYEGELSGEVLLDGRSLSTVKEKEISAFRRDNLGFVFQDFNLLDTFSLQDNIFLPLVLAGKGYKEMSQRLHPIAKKLGITELLAKYPYEVSGGQKQRAAVARALITSPKLVLADEPTGALDSRSTDGLLRIFNDINRDGQTILMVTHSTKAASHASRVLFIKDGEVFHQIYRGNNTNEQMYQKISDTLTLLATGGEQYE